MRLVVWNCQGHIGKKTAKLAALQPDIAVLSEVSPECVEAFGNGSSGLGIGTGQYGLAVVGFNGWRITPAPVSFQDRLFLPAIASNGSTAVQLIGCCVKQADGYVSPMLRMIEAATPFIRQAATIIAGDFNQTLALERTPSFQAVIDSLTGLQLQSAWHSHTGDAFGRERSPTYFHRRKDEPSSRFHIDYAFLPNAMAIKVACVGDFAEYVAPHVSDHIPLIVDFD